MATTEKISWSLYAIFISYALVLYWSLVGLIVSSFNPDIGLGALNTIVGLTAFAIPFAILWVIVIGLAVAYLIIEINWRLRRTKGAVPFQDIDVDELLKGMNELRKEPDTKPTEGVLNNSIDGQVTAIFTSTNGKKQVTITFYKTNNSSIASILNDYSGHSSEKYLPRMVINSRLNEDIMPKPISKSTSWQCKMLPSDAEKLIDVYANKQDRLSVVQLLHPGFVANYLSSAALFDVYTDKQSVEVCFAVPNTDSFRKNYPKALFIADELFSATTHDVRKDSSLWSIKRKMDALKKNFSAKLITWPLGLVVLGFILLPMLAEVGSYETDPLFALLFALCVIVVGGAGLFLLSVIAAIGYIMVLSFLIYFLNLCRVALIKSKAHKEYRYTAKKYSY